MNGKPFQNQLVRVLGIGGALGLALVSAPPALSVATPSAAKNPKPAAPAPTTPPDTQPRPRTSNPKAPPQPAAAATAAPTSAGAAAAGEKKPPKSGGFDHRLLDWFGYRSKLEDAGVSVEGAYIADYSYAFLGGANAHSDTFRSLLDLRLNLDLGKLIDLPGGSFSVDFQHEQGGNGSDHFGDIQGFDNIDADGRTQVAELWYQQWLGGKLLRFKVGKVDANSEFAFPEYAGAFLNSSFGVSPTLVALPTYPDPAPSFNVFLYPTDWLYAGYGIYDGALADGVSTGNHSPKTLWREPGHFFQIAEVGVRWSLAPADALPGRFAVGGFFHNGDFATFDGQSVDDTEGYYALLEQKLWAPGLPAAAADDAAGKTAGDTSGGGGGDRGLYATAQFGWADEEVFDIAQHLGVGLVYVGPWNKGNPDTVGLGVTAAFLSNANGSPYTAHTETSIEAFYQYRATSYLSIKPDLQYIIHPGGDASLGDALIGTLRVAVSF